jgi:hypothetical protein
MACWHGDVNLEVIIGMPLHIYVHSWDILRLYLRLTWVLDVDIELDGDGALNTYDNAHVITYIQVGEVLVGLTSKECAQVIQNAKKFLWEGNSFLWVWSDG